jgi:hypothetical protein
LARPAAAEKATWVRPACLWNWNLLLCRRQKNDNFYQLADAMSTFLAAKNF